MTKSRLRRVLPVPAVVFFERCEWITWDQCARWLLRLLALSRHRYCQRLGCGECRRITHQLREVERGNGNRFVTTRNLSCGEARVEVVRQSLANIDLQQVRDGHLHAPL